MKYFVIDIETTGLDRDKDQILEFAAIYDDGTTTIDACPTFTRVIKRERVKGSPYAMAMNQDLLRLIAQNPPPVNWCYEWELGRQFDKWAREQQPVGPLICGGQNFASFDLPFLRRLRSAFPEISHRTIEANMFYLRPDDISIPDTAECYRRATMSHPVSHRALADAIGSAILIRKGLGREV